MMVGDREAMGQEPDGLPGSPARLAPIGIMVVDDDSVLHDCYRRILADAEDRPFALFHAERGADAVAEAKRAAMAGDDYAVAFVDLRMTPMNGRETARRLRRIDPAINIVMVTGGGDVPLAEIARAAGPIDRLFFLAKPFTPAELLQTASALSARWRRDRELAAAHRQLAAQVTLLQEQKAELAANESRAIHVALHDSLTDAPNRLAFQRALEERTRAPGAFATAMLDLDRFKQVNDTLGHLAGDALIREICAILQRTAPAGAMVARLGGDEFGLLFDTIDDTAAVAAADAVIAACSVPLKVYGHSVQGGASAGLVVTIGGDGSVPVDVMRRADLALNEAKRQGRGQARLFDESMDDSIRLRRRMERRLLRAIPDGAFSLVYQPIVAKGDLAIVGFEALLRWHTEDFGAAIGPAEFLPVAEESNLIHDIGDWVLTQALAQVKEWPGQYVSINFSPRQFRRHHFAAMLLDRVTTAGVTPGRVQIEITERAVFDTTGQAADTLLTLRQMGFRVALDDFGTGYSSLYNIRSVALDCLKIDRSFIDGMGRDREAAAIVHSIIHLGRALGLDVAAEGVETEAQVQALRIAGAQYLQGFGLCRPVDPARAKVMAAARFVGAAADGESRAS
jgi:diguanylate cyclase (GGDEF)-like protein